MNIAIVGGGIVGLALGYKLSKVKGNKVHVFEKCSSNKSSKQCQQIRLQKMSEIDFETAFQTHQNHSS